MKILFFVPYPLKESPSQRFRFEQYFDVLSAKGIAYSCHSFWNLETWNILYKPGYSMLKVWGLLNGFVKRLMLLFSIHQYSRVFIHRECLPVGPPILEWLIASVFRKKIIYDFDDAIWLPNTSSENKMVAFIKCHWKVKSICRLSYKVSCGNEYLAKYAKHFNSNVIINPTTIDTENLHNASLFNGVKDNNTITIGWTGTHSTLKYLSPLIPVIEFLETRYPNLRFLVIADKKPDFQIASLQFIPWTKASEINDLLQIDIGIMPLTDDVWAKGKCGFKALQFMALNIPTVVSDVGVNALIVDHEVNGFVCQLHEDWYTYLEKIIIDARLRKAMSITCRQKIINCYSVSSNSSNFLSLFE